MKELTYIFGEKIADGYPSGRYVCTLLSGQMWDYYIVSAVLDYPSVRAVANSEAWSNAEVKKYGDLFYFRRDEDERPEVYTGNLGTSEQDYKLSLVDAIERAIEEYKAKGDSEAVKRLQNRWAAAIAEVYELIV